MRAVAVHADALVVTSRLWQTNAVAVRSGDEAVLIDSPYFPDELELLPTLLSQAAFDPNSGTASLSTARMVERSSRAIASSSAASHLRSVCIGGLAFPRLALGVGLSTAERLRAEPGVAQRELREADDEHYVRRPSPLSLGAFQELPVPGRVEVGDSELELHPCEGHTSDGTAFFAPFADVLACGDYLSDVEIPMIAPGGSLRDYRASLERLRPLVERSEAVVPGHGSAHDRETALGLLDEDLAYLDALERGDPRPRLPRGRDTARQRRIDEQNLAALRG